MTVPRHTIVCLALLAFALPVAAQVRDFNSAAELYGRGVHAYYAGQNAEAEKLFSAALAESANDPRILYFRALARLRLGQSTAARSDMANGAALEARQPGRYAVGAALARVQGGDRLLLEQFRQQARTKAAANRRPPLDQADEAAVLRNRIVLPIDELLNPDGPRPLTAEEIARRAAAIKAIREASAATTPATVAAAPEADPSATPGATAANNAAAPTASAAVVPPQPTELPEAEEMTAAEPEAESTPPAEEPTSAEPATEVPAASEEDPFGNLEEN
jgi:hypothetical protein